MLTMNMTHRKQFGKLTGIMLFMMTYAYELNTRLELQAVLYIYGISFFKTDVARCRNLSRAFASIC